MRQAFIETLCEIAAEDSHTVLISADLGFGVVEAFARRFPDRYLNVGVAEANAVGIATGLAEAGYIPYIYSISTFAALRPFEQFRNGPVMHRSRVRLIGVRTWPKQKSPLLLFGERAMLDGGGGKCEAIRELLVEI